MDLSVSPKDEIWFLRVCHHISNAIYQDNRREISDSYGSRCEDYRLLGRDTLYL